MQEPLPRGPFRSCKEIVLASASPRRQELLHRLGIDFRIEVSTALEPEWKGEPPEEFVLAAARSKAENVLRGLPRGVVLAADTAIAVDGEVLGKPDGRSEALSMLRRLAGRTHRVLTGCCLREKNGGAEIFVTATDVTMPRMDESVLLAYVRTGEYAGKAGAYAIQGVGSFLVREIRGSYTNVVGLPLREALSGLWRMNAVRTEQEEEKGT